MDINDLDDGKRIKMCHRESQSPTHESAERHSLEACSELPYE